jgi:fructose-bisphosphate aldolase class II
VRKINVDTDNRLTMTGAIRKVLMETPEKFDPRDYSDAIVGDGWLQCQWFIQNGEFSDYTSGTLFSERVGNRNGARIPYQVE